jgi:Spy/CpxP family protein refolding chaperone
MKKTLLIVGITVAVLGVATWSYAHGPGSGYGSGPGSYHMGPGMHGSWHMGAAGGPGYGPCWQTAELTPEQKKQAEEQAKAAMEQYIQRFLPGYKLEKKTAE